MPEDEGGARGGRFATTRWSVVLAARDRATPTSGEALSTLCRSYWYPLYAFARRRGMNAETAQDLTQGFFAKILEKNTLRHVDPGRGRFRTFLLTSFKHYMADEYDRQSARKRGGGQQPVSIDVEDAEGRYLYDPADTTTPEGLFERQWALTVLRQAIDRLREEYSGPRREKLFRRLRGYLVMEVGGDPYREAARDLEITEIGVRVAVHRLRRRYRAILLEEIAQTLGPDDDVEDELRYLLRAVESPIGP